MWDECRRGRMRIEGIQQKFLVNATNFFGFHLPSVAELLSSSAIHSHHIHVCLEASLLIFRSIFPRKNRRRKHEKRRTRKINQTDGKWTLKMIVNMIEKDSKKLILFSFISFRRENILHSKKKKSTNTNKTVLHLRLLFNGFFFRGFNSVSYTR